jgi:hypothetical protein
MGMIYWYHAALPPKKVKEEELPLRSENTDEAAVAGGGRV